MSNKKLGYSSQLEALIRKTTFPRSVLELLYFLSGADFYISNPGLFHHPDIKSATCVKNVESVLKLHTILYFCVDF